jgi:malate synthase
MRGDLTASFAKGGRTLERALEPDREWTDSDGERRTLRGRSLLFVRNVGHLMTNPAIQLPTGPTSPRGSWTRW